MPCLPPPVTTSKSQPNYRTALENPPADWATRTPVTKDIKQQPHRDDKNKKNTKSSSLRDTYGSIFMDETLWCLGFALTNPKRQ